MPIRASVRLWCLLWLCLAPTGLQGGTGLSFEPNRGQTAAEIRYLARTANGVIFVTDRGVTLSGPKRTVPAFQLLGTGSPAGWKAERPTGETISYYVGRDASKWVRDAPRFERLVRPHVYPGIDLVLYGTSERLEYDFLLAPHADPSQIRLKLESARRVWIDPDGTLIVDAPDGELRHHKPILTETLADGSWRSVAGSFRILGRDEVGFSVAGHDPALALSIDPVLESATYFGGSGDDAVVSTDGKGDLVGTTTSIDVPGASFARRLGTDVFIAIGQQTFVIGGSGSETVTSAVFSSVLGPSMVVVGGYTNSTDLPTTTNQTYYNNQPSLQPEYGGGATDGFLIILTQATTYNGYNLPWVTYIGGPGADRVNALALNSATLAIAGETNGGLPQPSFGQPSFQTTPAGGLDGFLMLANLIPSQPIQLYATNYLGGSGDDRALSVAINSYYNFYVTGETKSSDFPLAHALFSHLNGESDAFIAEITSYPMTLVASTLFGGSGGDQGVALTILPNGNVALAGITSSTDLSVLKPTQKAYGGGASDAFVAQFKPDLSALIASTYIGGSGADEATSIASQFPNTIFVGGWTASTDFPVVNALQPRYGGGTDDGFLVHFNDDGSIYEATFYGGSGSDQVLGLTTQSNAGPTVWLAGVTTSPNLPVVNATQTSLRGNSDGFIAEVSANLISAAPITGGKDLRGSVWFYYGATEQAGTPPSFTITSSDQSIVQVAADQTSPGQESVTIAAPASQPNYSGVMFYADCLADTGGASLTISGSGYPSSTVQANCLPQAISFAVGGTVSGGEIQTYVGTLYPPVIYPYQVPNPYVGLGQYGSFFVTRPGAAPVTVQIANSNPAIGTLAASSVTLPSNQNGVTFTPLAIGQTTLTLQAGNIPIVPPSAIHIVVTGLYSPPSTFSVASGFEAAFYMPAATSTLPWKAATITSGDPASVVVSLDSTKKGSRSVTLAANTGGVWVQALAESGDVPLTISVPGEPNLTTMVHITTAITVLQYGTGTGQSLQLPLGGSGTVSFEILSSDPTSGYAMAPNPGSKPITFSLQSSVANVVSISPATIPLASSGYSGSFQVTGTAVGSTVLALTNSANISAGGTTRSVTVQVQNVPVVISSVEVGKNLVAQATITLPVPASADTEVTLVIGDPTKALLSLDNTSAGLAQISGIIPHEQSSLSFYVYGLASSGQTTVTVSLAGSGPLTGNITLDPSGFYWQADGLSASLGGPQYASIQSGPLDPASMLPVGSQATQPGVTGVLGITNSNPGVLAINQSTLTLPLAGPGLEISANSPGSATLTLVQPTGFSTPSVNQQMTVTVATPQLTPYPTTLGKNTQTTLRIYGLVGNPPLTVTSSDPSKVLISTDPTVLGTGSLTATGQTFYLQALASSGTVTIHVSAPNYTGGSALFPLAPTGLGIALDTSNSAVSFQNGTYTTTTNSNAVNVQVSLYLPGNQGASLPFIPGMAPLTAQITSSNTGAAVITGSPVTIPVNPKQAVYYPLATATLLQVGPGVTTISISQPPGFTSTGSDKLTLDVVSPVLTGNNNTVGKDTVTTATIGLAAGVKPESVATPVTVTSSDPSRVLLSPDTSTAPSASITVSIQAGSTNANFYVYALSDNGNVPIQATAQGFGDGTFTEQLVPLGFGFTYFQTGPINAVLQAGPQQTGVGAALLLPNGSTQNFVTLRPGIPAIDVGVVSSDPTIVSVSPKQLVFSGSTTQGNVTYTPLKPGQATISLTVPSGYATVPSQSQLSIVVNTAALSFTTTVSQLGRDLQIPIGFGAQAPQQNMTVTLTSSDSSLLVLSTDPTVPGTPSVTMPLSSFGYPQVYAQGLAGSGSATITLTSSGYQTATLPISLTPTGAVFGNGPAEQNVSTSAGVIQQAVMLTPLDPVSLAPLESEGYSSVRSGANLSASVTSSNLTVVTVTPTTVQFAPPQQGSTPTPTTVGVDPVAAGTAIVTLGPVGDNPAPSSGNQLVFNVTEAELSIIPFTLGISLETPVQIKLGNTAPIPTSDVPVTVNGSYPIAVALNSGDLGQNSIVATIPAGHSASNPFYVQGLGNGSAALNYGGGMFSNFSTPVTVTQTAFVIKEAQGGQPLNLNVGASANLTILPALSPPSSAVAGPLSVSPGVNPITVVAASTEPGIVAVSPSQVTFNPGDQQVNVSVQGLAAGTATVKLLGTGYDFSQPQSSIQVVVK
jgi:hypothetical protein